LRSWILRFDSRRLHFVTHGHTVAFGRCGIEPQLRDFDANGLPHVKREQAFAEDAIRRLFLLQ
jgi:hypothetical protein